MKTEDIDRNRFVVDVTKTTFLEEGFAISRIGGSTAGVGNGLGGAKEKGGIGKQTSARPSSGKVWLTVRGPNAWGNGREAFFVDFLPCPSIVLFSTTLFLKT